MMGKFGIGARVRDRDGDECVAIDGVPAGRNSYAFPATALNPA